MNYLYTLMFMLLMVTSTLSYSQCAELSAPGPVRLDQNMTEYEIPFLIPFSGELLGLEVRLIGQEVVAGTYTISLEDPDGVSVTLIQDFICEESAFFEIFIDDNPSSELYGCPLEELARIQPVTPFSGLYGFKPNGTWKLKIVNSNTPSLSLFDAVLKLCFREESVTAFCTTPPPTTDFISGGIYQTQQAFSTGGVPEEGRTVYFGSNTSVTLTAGFSVSSPRLFQVEIGECSPPPSSTTPNNETNYSIETPPTNQPNIAQRDDFSNQLMITPNPSVSHTQINYKIETPSDIILSLIDMNGTEIRRLVEHKQQVVGTHTFPLSIGSLPKGVYFIRLKTNSGVSTQRLFLL